MPDLSTRIIFPSESGFLDDEPSSAEVCMLTTCSTCHLSKCLYGHLSNFAKRLIHVHKPTSSACNHIIITGMNSQAVLEFVETCLMLCTVAAMCCFFVGFFSYTDGVCC